MIQKNNKRGFGSVAAGVAGVAAVAGVAVAVSRALRNKKTRDRVKKTMTYMKGKAMDYVRTLEKKPEGKKAITKYKKIAKEVRKVLPKAKKIAPKVKRTVKKAKKVTK